MKNMTKKELIHRTAAESGVAETVVGKVFDASLKVIVESLSRREEVTLRRFGTFSVRERAERTGRNPRTGQPVRIACRRVVRFAPGTDLQDL